MSRRRRKIAANKIYQSEQRKKAFAVGQVSVDLAISLLRLVSKGVTLATGFQIETMKEMAKQQQMIIMSQPLSITKPDKYGKYKDYRVGGEIISIGGSNDIHN
jgi:hypothetical protein